MQKYEMLKKRFGIVLGLTLGLCLMYANLANSQTANGQATNNPAASADLFQHRCAGCHGDDGRANTHPGKSLKAIDFHDPAVMQMSNADLTAIIRNGKNRMPPFGSRLSPGDVQHLVAYIRTLQKQ